MAVNEYDLLDKELENGHRRKLEDDPYKDKLFARCIYKNGMLEEVDVTGKSIFEILGRKDKNEGMISFQIHKKRTLVRDDVEIGKSYDEKQKVYFGRRESAYEYYQKTTGRVPVGMINERTGKPITEDDLLKKYYVVFPDGFVIKDPDSGFKTFNEVLLMLKEQKDHQQEKDMDQEEQPKKSL